jgi:hypothetical protein
MTGVDQRKTKLIALVERYCALGRLLPSVEDIDTDDDVELAEVKMVLAEMNRTKSEMDALLEVRASSSRLEHIAGRQSRSER